MCLRPVTIKNPYCGCDPTKGYNYLHDCRSVFIQVPCGHCKDCISTRQSAYAVRSDVESYKYRSVPFMLTITYNNEMIPRMPVVGDVLDNLPVLCWKHVSDMFKRLRIFIERNPDSALSKLIPPPSVYVLNGRNRVIPSFKYLFVGEYGKNHLRPHFHALIYIVPPYKYGTPRFYVWRDNVVSVLGDWFKENWAINIGTRKNPVYKKLYTHVVKRTKFGIMSTFDFHAVVHSDEIPDNSPIYYVSKYLFKPSKKLEKFRKMVYAKWMNGEISDERFKVFNSVTTRNLRLSKYFGFPLDEIQMERVQFSISQSINQKCAYPVFFSSSGKSEVFPQYLKRLLTPDQATYFSYNLNINNDERQTLKDSERNAQLSRESENSLRVIGDCIRCSDDVVSDFLWHHSGSCEAQFCESADESEYIYKQSDNREYFSECSDNFAERFYNENKVDVFEQLYLFNI